MMVDQIETIGADEEVPADDLPARTADRGFLFEYGHG
jgi:hypothetical protein